MDENIAKEFYSRADIQERILHFSKNREIGVMFNGYFGKRPDVIENYFDIKTLVNKGVRSFHSSEERWLNPLILGGEKKPQDRDSNRLGWDLILDLDGVSFEYSQIV
jgi:DNA primase catalytic subunit